jgi:hypothetical protein
VCETEEMSEENPSQCTLKFTELQEIPVETKERLSMKPVTSQGKVVKYSKLR